MGSIMGCVVHFRSPVPVTVTMSILLNTFCTSPYQVGGYPFGVPCVNQFWNLPENSWLVHGQWTLQRSNIVASCCTSPLQVSIFVFPQSSFFAYIYIYIYIYILQTPYKHYIYIYIHTHICIVAQVQVLTQWPRNGQISYVIVKKLEMLSKTNYQDIYKCEENRQA